MARARGVVALHLLATLFVGCAGARTSSIASRETHAPPEAPPASSSSAIASASASPSTAPPPAHDEPSAAMTCLARHYAVSAVHDGASRWSLALPDGARITGDEVDELFSVPYPTGPIVPIDRPQTDPGAIRLDAMLSATYGADAKAVWSALVSVPFAGHVVKIHRRVEAPLRRVAARIEAAERADPSLARALAKLGGTYNWRVIAGTNELSSHAWGIAIDLDPAVSDYWRNAPAGAARWRNRMPEAIVRAFEAEGFIWGGRWYYYDTMHFEYRPELLDPTCAAKP